MEQTEVVVRGTDSELNESFCHIDDRRGGTYCCPGREWGANDITCPTNWEGENVCPDCGKFMCPSCVSLADLEDLLEETFG